MFVLDKTKARLCSARTSSFARNLHHGRVPATPPHGHWVKSPVSTWAHRNRTVVAIRLYELDFHFMLPNSCTIILCYGWFLRAKTGTYRKLLSQYCDKACEIDVYTLNLNADLIFIITGEVFHLMKVALRGALRQVDFCAAKNSVCCLILRHRPKLSKKCKINIHHQEYIHVPDAPGILYTQCRHTEISSKEHTKCFTHSKVDFWFDVSPEKKEAETTTCTMSVEVYLCTAVLQQT
jgi:hypothetical protein